MNIYLDTNEFQSIAEYLEDNDGVFESEDMERAFDRLSLSMSDGIERIGLAYLEMGAREAAIKNEINRLREMQAKEKTRAANLKKTLKYALNVLKIKHETFDTFSVSLRKAPDMLPDDFDPGLVPDDCFDVVPETRKISRKRLLAKIKESPIDGIELIKNRTSVVIR